VNLHAAGLHSNFQKNYEKWKNSQKYGFLPFLARFVDDVSMTSSWGPGLGDVSMTSSGDVAVSGRSTGAVRWRTGVAI